ncbi:MAG: haloacid dehalogenase-like hydrolase [Acidobacteriota bacterium]
MRRRPFVITRLLVVLLAAIAAAGCTTVDRPATTPRAAGDDPAPPDAAIIDPLPSWHDTDEKRAILDFVMRVTRPDSPDFLPPAQRVATFDFDGTIGCEKPDYMEVMVAVKRLCERATEDPALRDEDLYRAACDGDLATINSQVEDALLEAFEGASQRDYVDTVARFLDTQRHPRFDRPYGQLHYAPMRELIDWLRRRDFAVHIVSGSQQGFTRTYASHVLGLAPAHAIGHAVALDFAVVDDAPVLQRQDAFRAPSIDGKGKAEVIRQRIGQRPVLAFGNSMGDFEMLQYATSGPDPGLALILVHDDPDEYVYRDETLIGHAESSGWRIVRMAESFRTIFAER